MFEINNRKEQFQLFETYDNFREISCDYDLIKCGTNIAILSLKYHTYINLVERWIEESKIILDNSNTFKSDTYLKVKKSIVFDYEKSVKSSANGKELIKDREEGRIEYSLNYPSELNNENVIYYSQIVDRPAMMDRCNEYFFSRALLSIN